MNNLWALLGITIAVVFVTICFVIHEFIVKDRYYIIKILFTICLAVFYVITDIPYMQDLVEQETTVVIAEYKYFQSGGTSPGTRRLFFETQNGEFDLLATIVSKTVAFLEEGNIYEVEYFNHSKVIKEYRLVK